MTAARPFCRLIRPRRSRLHPLVCILLLAVAALLGACATPQRSIQPPRRPADVKAQIVRLLPSGTPDAQAWATDISAAFSALGIDASRRNLCAAVAVTAQESTFTADPAVPGLGTLARGEIERRAAQRGVPKLLLAAALHLKSPDGKRYDQRLSAVRTERELSEIYVDFIGMVPLGQRLFAGANPVRTGGPMQVAIDFAERHAKNHPYPYPVESTIRHEVFTRRGGLYFGIAHLLGYPVSYDRMLYRFADFNAGLYASRNAAFQNAVVLASGIPLALDGDLIQHDSSESGKTELAVRSLAKHLDMSDARIRRDLEQGNSLKFEQTTLYTRMFELAEKMERQALPRAMIPRITLKSPKITRPLTTEWFATRVDQRYRSCLAKDAEKPKSGKD